MIRNYILVTFRNLWKYKVFTFINIAGLGIALAVCIVAFFNHMFNYNFDRNNENFNQIYRVTSFRDMQGREQEYGLVPATLGLEVKKDIAGIEKAARLVRSGSPVKRGDDVFPASISYVDPDFLDIFTFNITAGNKNAINDHGSILISSKMASTLFGNEYPVGRIISIVNDNNEEFTYTVGAVFEELPQNSSFRIDVLSHFDNFLLMWKVKDADWRFFANCLFLQIPQKNMVPAVRNGLKAYIPVQNRAREDFRINRFSLVPLDDVGENTRTIWSSGLFPGLHPAALIAPAVMAVFILLIACFNFANTSLAVFSKRLKEIGLRKTFGGQRKDLVVQFMLETLIICMLALIAALVIAEFLVPAYSSLWSYMSIELTFTGYWFFWIFLVLLTLFTGFISGVYPAFYVSTFSPAGVFRGNTPVGRSGKLSVALLTLQFTISVASLVLGISFAMNARFQKTVDLGYDRNDIIVVPVNPLNFASLRNEVLSDPRALMAEGTQNHIGYGSYRRTIKDNTGRQLEVDVLDIGPDYAQTMGLRLAEGRLFDRERAEADMKNGSIVINRRFARDFGWTGAQGKTVTLNDTTRLTVIGLVEDFYLNGVWEAIEPVMLRVVPGERYNILAVRAKPSDMAGLLGFISEKWKSISPNMLFGGRFQNDLMQEGEDINRSILKVNVFLAIVATLLSLIGMYNMVSLDTLKRNKEIGIRKIQGASVPGIMYLVSRKYIYILLLAAVAGSAFGYKMSTGLMDSIWDYFVSIGAGVLLSASIIMIIATFFTIVFKVARAATRNPVDSLRYE